MVENQALLEDVDGGHSVVATPSRPQTHQHVQSSVYYLKWSPHDYRPDLEEFICSMWPICIKDQYKVAVMATCGRHDK